MADSDLATVARSAAECCLVDSWTAEAVSSMQAEGVRPLLLKGPVLARWLYPDDAWSRSYIDVDLLVGPDEIGRAREVLAALGFTAPRESWLSRDPVHSEVWLRPRDGANIDLHRTLHGCELSTDWGRVWEVVSAETDRLDVQGVSVEIPSPVVLALHVVLHFGNGGSSQPSEDLRRALDIVDDETWQRAGRLARVLGVTNEMGAKLRQLPAGLVQADRLGLPASPVLWPALLQERPESRVVARFLTLRGWRARTSYLGTKILPPAGYMRSTRPLARAGWLGLVVAHIPRLVSLVIRVPSAVSGWRHARLTLRRQIEPVGSTRSPVREGADPVGSNDDGALG